MSDKITVKLPREIIELSELSLDGLEAKSLLIWVLELYSEGIISLSKSSSILGMKNDEFHEEFRKRRLNRVGGPQTEKEAEEDLEVARQLLSGS
ncbi:MAG: UPF0175 family protein [Candidatus Hodarchaeales archaeon]